MDSTWITTVAVSVCVPLAFAGLRRAFPAPPPLAVERSLEDLQREYGRWELLALPLLFGVAPLAGYVWWRLFVALADPAGFSQAGDAFSLRPTELAWALPALFLGLVSSVPVMDALYRRLLQERYREYTAFQNLKHGIDSEAISRPFIFGFGGLAALGAVMLASWYIVLGESELRINPFFGVSERVYTWQDVAEIKTAPALIAPNGNVVERREYVVRFADGASWATTFDPSEADEAQIEAVMRRLAERSGVAIAEVPLLERADFD